MLSDQERLQLELIAKALHDQNPRFVRQFAVGPIPSRGREHGALLMVMLGAIVLCVGVACLSIDFVVGTLIAGLGTVCLIQAVKAARRSAGQPDEMHA